MSYGFTPGTASQPTSEIELTVSCRSLEGKDILSKSDPMCVMYTQPFGEKRWVETYRSEAIQNDHNPDFTKKVHIAYRFEEQQCLKFEVYDVDSTSTNLADHDFIGSANCTLAQIVSSGKVQMPLKNRMGGDSGVLQVTSEELSSSRDEVFFQFSGHKLDKKTFFWKSSPCLVIHKSTESGDFVVVHKTEVSSCTLNPDWARFGIPVRDLCNSDFDRNLKFVVYHGNPSDGSIIGMFFATLKQLSTGPGVQNSFQCIHPQKQKKKGSAYKDSGTISLTYYELRKVHSFVDYIKGGTQIHCSVAIDFTASNGNPTDPSSLHYTGTNANPYELAITSVVRIIEDYDSDKMLPVLGFGARLPPDGRVSHEFFVNLHPTDPYCKGVGGILAAYRSCLMQVQLHGPTNFSPVIHHVARFATSYKDGDSYFILLILTDGEITDMPQTTQAIVEASTLPMSIIIVGIGNSDFTNMETLDGDTVALHSGGKRAARDIVQFVPFNKFLSGDPSTARLRLAREVLAEVPTQFLSYMKAKKIQPKPPQTNVQILLPPDPEAMR